MLLGLLVSGVSAALGCACVEQARERGGGGAPSPVLWSNRL